MTIKPNFSESKLYKDSPVAQIIIHVLSRINEIKKKYQKEPSSPEKINAFKQIESLELVLKVVHENFLPEFSNRATPNLSSTIVSFVILHPQITFKLKNAHQEFYSKKYSLFLAINQLFPLIAKQALKNESNPEKAQALIKQHLKQQIAKLSEKTKIFDPEITNLFNELMKDTYIKLPLEEKFIAPYLKELEDNFPILDTINLAITHPMIADLASLITEVLLVTPNELQELKRFVPFFNPQSLSSLKYKDLEITLTKPEIFEYEIKIFEETKTTTTYYKDFRELFFSILIKEMSEFSVMSNTTLPENFKALTKQFFTEYPNSTLIQNYNDLQITTERHYKCLEKSIEQCVSPPLIRNYQEEALTDPQKILQAIDNELTDTDALLTTIATFFQNLETIKAYTITERVLIKDLKTTPSVTTNKVALEKLLELASSNVETLTTQREQLKLRLKLLKETKQRMELDIEEKKMISDLNIEALNKRLEEKKQAKEVLEKKMEQLAKAKEQLIAHSTNNREANTLETINSEKDTIINKYVADEHFVNIKQSFIETGEALQNEYKILADVISDIFALTNLSNLSLENIKQFREAVAIFENAKTILINDQRANNQKSPPKLKASISFTEIDDVLKNSKTGNTSLNSLLEGNLLENNQKIQELQSHLFLSRVDNASYDKHITQLLDVFENKISLLTDQIINETAKYDQYTTDLNNLEIIKNKLNLINLDTLIDETETNLSTSRLPIENLEKIINLFNRIIACKEKLTQLDKSWITDDYLFNTQLQRDITSLDERYQEIGQHYQAIPSESYPLTALSNLFNSLDKNITTTKKQIFTNTQGYVHTVLNDISTQIDTNYTIFPVKQDVLPIFDKINTLFERVTELENNQIDLKQLPHQKEALCDRLTQLETIHTSHIETINQCQIELENYNNARPERFLFKDRISPNDAKRRITFVTNLTQELITYQNNPTLEHAQTILTSLEKQRADFPGTELQPILSKLGTLFINAINRPLEKVAVDHEAAINLIKTHTNSHYRKAILNLYKKIDEMSKHGAKLIAEKATVEGETAQLFAKELMEEVDRFALNAEKPSLEAYETFKTEFSFILHSKDKEMRTHRNSWTPIIGNMFAGLVTLGLALVAKAIYSKATTGYTSLFFHTTREEKIDNIAIAMVDVEKSKACFGG